MCFRWLKRIYHCLRRRWARRRRGYSREISVRHRRFCSGGFSGPHGHGSFSCGGEGSLSYGRSPSGCPGPAAHPHSALGAASCDAEGSIVVTSGHCGGTSGWGTSGWGVTVGTVPVYGSGVGYSSEDLGPVVSSTGGGGGSAYRGGDLGIPEGGGAGYGYSAAPGHAVTAGAVTEGSGYHGGGSGYGAGAFPGAELSPGAGGCAQVVQQKCPVVVPSIQTQQCKQSSRWPPSQKK